MIVVRVVAVIMKLMLNLKLWLIVVKKIKNQLNQLNLPNQLRKKMEKKVTIKDTVKDTPKKTLVEGEDFKELQRRSKKLGAKSLDYSNRKNNKYVVEYEGKKIHFGSNKYEDYLIHKDKERRKKYLLRAERITNKDGEFTYKFPQYPNYWAVKLLWN